MKTHTREPHLTKVEPESVEPEEKTNGESKPPVEHEKKSAEPEKLVEPEKPVELEKAVEKPSNVKEIVARANELYEMFKSAGFSRDSYIELGESIKKGKTFKEVHPVVQRLIMKVAKSIFKID